MTKTNDVDRAPVHAIVMRTFAGIRFQCERPGQWVSECKRFGIYELLGGTSQQQWMVYEDESCSGDPMWNGAEYGMGMTMAEAICDAWPNVEWDKVRRKHGIGSA